MLAIMLFYFIFKKSKILAASVREIFFFLDISKKRFASSRSFSFAVLERKSQNCSSVSPDRRRASGLFNCPRH